jgi:hypothetical protein
MKRIDTISATKISDLSYDDIKYWLIEEIADLCNDMGQKLDDDQKQHIPTRMMLILVDKYRNWEPGKIHSIFQKGISGGYGKGMKITIALLLSWITQEDRLYRGENVSEWWNEPEISESEKQRYREISDRCAPFVRYCHDRWIDITELSKDAYFALRDRFNKYGPLEIQYELDSLPRYKSTSVFVEIKLNI